MDILFADEFLFIYIFAILAFLRPEKLAENQKIFLVYIVSFLVDTTDKVETITLILTAILFMFLYIEYFSSSVFKLKIMTNPFYKILDFCYIMITQYSFLSFIFVIFCNTNYVVYIFSYIDFFQDNQSIFTLLLHILQAVTFACIANSIMSLKWEIHPLDTIKKTMDECERITSLPSDFTLQKMEIVTRIEDKSFQYRTKVGTIFSFEYMHKVILVKFKNYYSTIKNKKKYDNKYVGISNIINCIHSLQSFPYRVKVTCRKIKSILTRGHSTIEAQLIRSIGIKNGFNRTKTNIIKRKIFEIIYVKIYFGSLYQYFKKNRYINNEKFMDYILYIYLHKARVEYNNHVYCGLKELFNKEVSKLSNNELFVGTLMFSKYRLDVHTVLENARLYNHTISKIEVVKILHMIDSVETQKHKLHNILSKQH